MENLTRRTALAITGAGLTAAMAGVAASMAAPIEADAELVRLGKAMVAELVAYDGICAERHRLHREIEHLLVPFGPRVRQTAFFAASEANGHEAACQRQDASWQRLENGKIEILALEPRTLAGFAAVAVALQWDIFYSENGIGERDDDYLDEPYEKPFHAFVAALLKAGGMS